MKPKDRVHFHTLVPEGVWHERSDGSLGFHPLPPPIDEDVEDITARIVGKLRRLLERRDGECHTVKIDGPTLRDPLS